MCGALIDPTFLATVGAREYAFSVLLLVLVRPLALPLSLAGSRLERLEYAAAAWFGPKGFASVVYAVLILQPGIARADQLFHLVGWPSLFRSLRTHQLTY
jgi:sodium/hydrogen antiporter